MTRKSTSPLRPWRRHLGTVKELVELAKRNLWREDWFSDDFELLESPLSFLEKLVAKCREAKELLDPLKVYVTAENQQEFLLVYDSCRAAEHTGAYWVEAIECRLLYEGALNEENGAELRRILAQRCLESYRRTMTLNEDLLKVILDFPGDYYDLPGYLKWFRQIVEFKTKELAEFERDLKEVVGGE